MRRLLTVLLTFAILVSLYSLTHAAPEPQEIFFFYSPDCRDCHYIIEKIIPQIKSRYSESIRIVSYNIEELDNYLQFIKLEEEYGQAGNDFPAFFVNHRFLSGKPSIAAHIFDEIESMLQSTPASSPRSKKSEPEQNTTDTIARQLSIVAIVSGGFLDGINPCVFTVIIFFISYLSFLKAAKRTIFCAGIFFIAGCFLAYYALGLGMFALLSAFEAWRIIHLAIKGIVIVSLGVLAVLNAYDVYRIIQGNKMKLKLSTGQISKIHAVIRKLATLRYAAPLSLIIGAIVSLIEFPCTGQIYVPIILLIQKRQLGGYWYLLLYNICFILPLVGVFLILYIGRDIGKVYAEKIFIIKIFLAVFFAALLVLYLFFM